jgi:hypothetical protein
MGEEPTMNDEQLILYYYADGLSRAERRRIEAALAADPVLRRRYEALQRDLDAVEDSPDPAPAHLVRRWQDSIDRAAQRERQPAQRRPWRWHPASVALGGALAAALAIGVGIGLYLADPDAAEGPAAAAPAIADSPRPDPEPGAFSRGLEAHFLQSRQDLDALPVEDSESRRLLILHIVQQNRLFAREAVENASPELARVLRAFEPILVQLAADDLDPEEAQRLQDKLAFELNVMLTKLNRPPSNPSESI